MRIALVLSFLLASSIVEAARAPRTSAPAAAQTTGAFGFRPTPMSYSHLRKGLRSGAKGFRGVRDEIPSRWDSRERGRVTSVKNQNPYGTCWAFSTMAALETAVLKDSGGTVTNDYSENHLARHNVGFLLDYNAGGNNQIAAALLSAWRDPLREEDNREVDEAYKRAVMEYGAASISYLH